jgi:hypothetical protein
MVGTGYGSASESAAAICSKTLGCENSVIMAQPHAQVDPTVAPSGVRGIGENFKSIT